MHACRSTLEDPTPALDRFLLPSDRRGAGELLAPGVAWTFLRCEETRGNRVERLGEAIARTCYARGIRDEQGSLVEASYTADGRAAFLDWYDF